MPDTLPVTGEQQAGVTPGAAVTTPLAQPTGETLEDLRAQFERVQAALKDANKESAARRKRLEELETLEQQRVEAGKTEAQKLADQVAKANAERDAALTRASETLIRSAVITEAAKLQFRDPSDALQFIDKTKVKINEDGSVDGLAPQLAAIAKAKPYLLTTSMLGAQSPSNPGQGAQQGETREQRRARIFGAGGTPIGSKTGGGGYVPLKE